MFIQRNYERTERDDFVLNVEHVIKTNTDKEAVEVRTKEHGLLGWKIQNKYE